MTTYYGNGPLVPAFLSVNRETVTIHDCNMHGNNIVVLDGGIHFLGTNILNSPGTIYFGSSSRDGNNFVKIDGVTDPNHMSWDHVQTFINSGVITSQVTSNTYIKGMTPGATFANMGVVHVGRFVDVNATVLGNGTMDFMPPNSRLTYGPGLAYAELEFDKSVAAGQQINMHNDGILALGDLPDFHATIQEFTGLKSFNPNNSNLLSQDTIDLIGRPSITAVTYHGNQTGGALTVYNWAHAAVGSINFSGDYTHAHFSITHSGNDSLIRI